MSKKKRSCCENVEAPATAKRVNSERNDDRLLWRIVTDHPDIFDTHIVPKLNGNDLKFFYDVNSESRAAIKRSGVHLAVAFKIRYFDTKSTLSWALEKCTKNKERFCAGTARSGNLELLKFVRGKGCPWYKGTCSEAAFGGHLECLKYAHENGCPWDQLTCSWAAKNGQLECLQYARKNGCPWDEGTCCWAAYNGHLECLKYLHENGCPWDCMTCWDAALKGHLECVKYARANGCPWPKWACPSAAKRGNLKLLKCLHENGCDWGVSYIFEEQSYEYTCSSCQTWSFRVFEICVRKRV